VSDIIWEDPPEKAMPERWLWNAALQHVKSKPGRWAAVRSYRLEHSARASLSQLRHRKVKYPEGNWQFVVSKRKADGRYWVYAKYDGS
jgi:hypothetical protein